MKKPFSFLLILMLTILTGVGIPACKKASISNPPQAPLEKEIWSLAQSDVNHTIPRRTEFVVKLYSDQFQTLTPPKIRKIYDEEYSQQTEKKHFHKLLESIIISIIILSILALSAWLIRKRLVTRTVTVNLPFGIGGVELETTPVERSVAWSLYVELVTRIAMQPLRSDEGLLREALTSLHSLFGTTREILKEADPVVGVSSKSVGGIAIDILNKGLRPFLAKWHPILEEWEIQRLGTVSCRQHEKGWFEESQLRIELEKLRQDLRQYAGELAKIAHI